MFAVSEHVGIFAGLISMSTEVLFGGGTGEGFHLAW